MTRLSVFMAVSVASVGALSAATLPLSDDYARAKAEEIVAKMTLEQKVSLLGGWHTMYLTDIPEVGIARKWAFSDATHGIKPEHNRWDWPYVPGVDNRCTVLPCGSALASTWNPELSAAHGHVQGEQMRDRGKDQMLGPGVNINRTPLCGRNWEYMSEDPYLTAKMCVPMIRAVQSHGVAATIKHFCVNNQELNRYGVDTIVDERTLHEIYLPAFRAAVKEGEVLCLMTAYNKFNGKHTSENDYLLKGVLRDRWGYLGQIVTDWGGQHSTVPAALGGANIEMNRGMGIVYFTNWKALEEGKIKSFPLVDAVRAGKVPEATVTEAALRVVYVMAKTGFLDGVQEKGRRFAAEHRATANRIGDESIVLLKNTRGVLPLAKKDLRRVVVLGLQSDLTQCHLGSSAGSNPEYEISSYQGIREALGPDVRVDLLPLGAEVTKGGAPAAIPNGCLETYVEGGGEAFAARGWEEYAWAEGEEWANGKERRMAYIEYPTGSAAAARRYVAKVRAAETGAHCLSLVSDGHVGAASIFLDGERVFHLSEGKAHVQAVELEKGRVYEVRLDVSRSDCSNSFVFGWLTPVQLAGNTADKAKLLDEADAVIAFTGSQLGYGRAHESEEYDIPSMLGPIGHDAEIAELLKKDIRNFVVVHRSGTQMEMPWADDCPTLLHVSYLGQEAGRPLARVLFGDVNPSGKLVSTWPRKYADLGVAEMGTYNDKSVIYNERFYVGYRWFDAKGIKPLFPFGYGLSYTTFGRSAEMKDVSDGSWKVAVKVRNTGKIAGKDVVQLYVAPVDAKVERVVKELKGFAKTAQLAPGAEETLTMTVTSRDLAYYDDFLHRWHAPAGTYRLLVGTSAADTFAEFTVTLGKDRVFTLEEE